MRVAMIAVLVLSVVAGARAAETPLVASKEYKGRVSNEQAKLAPPGGYVSGPKAWAKLWKDWKMEGKLPVIDWKKEIVLLAMSGGSGMGLTASVTEAGDLKMSIIATADITPDTGYRIIVVPSKGVKTIGGKAPKFEKKDEEP